jgi:hypothetical protein
MLTQEIVSRRPRLKLPSYKTDAGTRFNWQQLASGLQAVREKENTDTLTLHATGMHQESIK